MKLPDKIIKHRKENGWSQEDFAEKLKIIEKNGTQVVVIPGNHDVDYPFCYGYGETQYYSAERMTDEEFEKIYADYGLKKEKICGIINI